MAIQYGGRVGLLGQLMQSQERNSRRQADAIKAMFPSDTEKREKLNLQFGNSLLNKANPGEIFRVGKRNKLMINPEFNMGFPDLETAWAEYSQMANDYNITPNRAAFEQSYSEADSMYRERVSKTLNSASANFSQKDIKEALKGNQGLLKYVMGQASIDPTLAPYATDKKGLIEKITGLGGEVVGGATGVGILGAVGKAYDAKGVPSWPAIKSVPGKAFKGAQMPFTMVKDGFNILKGARKGIFSNKEIAYSPQDANFVKKIANKLNMVGGKPEQSGKQALKMLKNLYNKEGIKGIFKPLAKKIGKKQALIALARLGVGGAGMALPTGVTQIGGAALSAYTAYQIFDIIKDEISGSDNLEAGTTF